MQDQDVTRKLLGTPLDSPIPTISQDDDDDIEGETIVFRHPDISGLKV